MKPAFRRCCKLALSIAAVLLPPPGMHAQDIVPNGEALVTLIRTDGIEVATETFRALRAADPDGPIFPATATSEKSQRYWCSGRYVGR